MTRHEFTFAPSYRLPARLAGVTARTAYADLDPDGLHVRFGPWRLRSSLDNITGHTLTGGFAYLKTAGPAHLSLRDRGVTFATNGDAAVCVSFRDPVPGIDPTRIIKHPGATLTVADPAAFAAELDELLRTRS